MLSAYRHTSWRERGLSRTAVFGGKVQPVATCSFSYRSPASVFLPPTEWHTAYCCTLSCCSDEKKKSASKPVSLSKRISWLWVRLCYDPFRTIKAASGWIILGLILNYMMQSWCQLVFNVHFITHKSGMFFLFYLILCYYCTATAPPLILILKAWAFHLLLKLHTAYIKTIFMINSSI